jgi:hypothetical protein
MKGIGFAVLPKDCWRKIAGALTDPCPARQLTRPAGQRICEGSDRFTV